MAFGPLLVVLPGCAGGSEGVCKKPRILLHVSTDCAQCYVCRRECTGPIDGFRKGEEALLVISAVIGRLFGEKRLSPRNLAS